MTEKSIDFYEKLKKQLEDTSNFPQKFLYKFILPSEENKKQELLNIFASVEKKVESKTSSNGKYTSFSIEILAKSADEIIHFYKEAGKITGIVSL